MESDHALERAVGADDLEAEALDPDPVAEPVLHAELDAEGPGTDGELLAELVGGGAGVVGVDQLPPVVDRVGQLGVGVAQKLLPGRRVAGAAALDVEVEKPDGALLGEQPEAVVIGRRRGPGGRQHRGDEPGRVAEGLLDAHAHVARGAALRQHAERDGLVEGGGEDDLPLRLQPVGIVGHHIEGEQAGEMGPDQRAGLGLPQGLGGGVGGGHPPGRIQQHNRAAPRRDRRSGGGVGWVGDRRAQSWPPFNQSCVRLARKSMNAG